MSDEPTPTEGRRGASRASPLWRDLCLTLARTLRMRNTIATNEAAREADRLADVFGSWAAREPDAGERAATLEAYRRIIAVADALLARVPAR